MGRLTDNKALITGGASGIGLATGAAFSRFGRMAMPDEIAGLIVYVSDEAHFVTGPEWVIDAGKTAR